MPQSFQWGLSTLVCWTCVVYRSYSVRVTTRNESTSLLMSATRVASESSTAALSAAVRTQRLLTMLRVGGARSAQRGLCTRSAPLHTTSTSTQLVLEQNATSGARTNRSASCRQRTSLMSLLNLDTEVDLASAGAEQGGLTNREVERNSRSECSAT